MVYQSSNSPLGKRFADHLPTISHTRFKHVRNPSAAQHLQSRELTHDQRPLLNALHRDLSLAFEKTKIQVMTSRQIEILTFTGIPRFIFQSLEEGSHPLTKLFEEVFVEVNILQACTRVSVSPHYPIYFCKDELLSSLRVHLAFFVQLQKSSPDHPFAPKSEVLAARIASYYSWIRQLGKIPDFYLSSASLPKHFPQTHLNTAKKFVPSSSVLLFSGYNAYLDLKQLFNLRYRADLRSYYVKSDLDGRCEIKAQRILSELTRGFKQFHELYQVKFRADFRHGRIGSHEAGICVVSKEVVAGREDSTLFERYSAAYLNFKASQFRNSAELDQHRKDLMREEAIFDSHGKSSIPFHVLMDLLFLSCDSHAGQYVPISDTHKNVEYVNIDFSCILPTSEVAIDRDGHLISLFRSAYVFAPHNLKPMTPELIALIKSWNIESLRNRLQHLVGTLQEFTWQTYAYRRAYENGDIQTALNTIAQNCYSKIHPVSFELFLDRLSKTQEYVKITSQPTIYGLFVYLYPDLAAIMTVLTRRISHPSELVGNNKKEEGGLAPKPIASYLDKIQRDRLATSEEWKLLMHHYANLKRKAISSEDVIQFFAGT